jgi:hypothetical protein
MPTIELVNDLLMISQELVDHACGVHGRITGTLWTWLRDGEDTKMGLQAKWPPMTPDAVEAPEVVSVVGDISPCRAAYASCAGSSEPDCPASTVRVTSWPSRRNADTNPDPTSSSA